MTAESLPNTDRSIFSLEGRIALVAGAGGHLGRSMSTALAEAGCSVLLNGRRPGPLEDLRDSLRNKGLSAEIVAGNALSPETSDRIKHLLEKRGRLHVLIHSAYWGTAGTVDTVTDQHYGDAYSVTVVGAARLTRELLPFLTSSEPETSSIINVASMYGHVSPDPRIYASGANNPPHYGAAKAALIQWSRYAAVHLAPRRIRVNSISPGAFPAPIIEETSPEFVASLVQKVPLARIGRPDDLKGAVIFLASEASAYVTGADIKIDGGWTAW